MMPARWTRDPQRPITEQMEMQLDTDSHLTAVWLLQTQSFKRIDLSGTIVMQREHDQPKRTLKDELKLRYKPLSFRTRDIKNSDTKEGQLLGNVFVLYFVFTIVVYITTQTLFEIF